MANDDNNKSSEAKGTSKLISSPTGGSAARTVRLVTDFRTEEIRGYLFKKTRDGKWQKRWFETNGCFLTYYKKQGQKLLAALNLPQVGAIKLVGEDSSDGAGLFTIELNERVYTIKARSQEEAAFWVDALLWRQAGHVVTQKSPLSRPNSSTNTAKEIGSSASSSLGAVEATLSDDQEISQMQKEGGGGCASCCVVQ